MHGNLRGAGGNITTRPENHSDWSARTRAGRSHVLFEPDVSGGGYVATVAAGKPAGWRSTAGGEYLAEFLGTFVLIMFGDGVVAMTSSPGTESIIAKRSSTSVTASRLSLACCRNILLLVAKLHARTFAAFSLIPILT